MSSQQEVPVHDLKAIAIEFPELSPSTTTSEVELKVLQAKYGILLQIADQSLRDRELRLKEGARRIDRFTNPLVVGIFVGALGLVGTFLNGVVSNRNQKVQLQNDLIKEAIKPQTEEERAKSLVFFAKNGLIDLDEKTLASLVEVAGTDRPVPGSSGDAALGLRNPRMAAEIKYSASVVTRIRATPGVPYPPEQRPATHRGDTTRTAIILHDAVAGDNSIELMRTGRADLRGPLAHWAVQSDGAIAFIADETQRANHVGPADRGVRNTNAIGIEVTGIGALSDERQVESLVRLVADVADRWGIPTSMILSHAEVALPRGRKIDMAQQAPIIRQMVDSVRKHR